MDEPNLEERNKIMKKIQDLGDRNKFVCPHCGEDFTADPSDYDYDNNPTISCPICETELAAITERDFWYEQDQTDFTATYLKDRGLPKLPLGTTWTALEFYLIRFLAKRQEHCNELDIYPEYVAAYDIIKEYIDKPVIKDEEEKDVIQQV